MEDRKGCPVVYPLQSELLLGRVLVNERMSLTAFCGISEEAQPTA